MIDSDDPEMTKTVIEVIERNVKQMNYIVAHLDPAFDIRSNVIIEVDLYKLVTKIFESFEVLIDNKIRLVNNVSENFRKILSDRNKIEEILTNLIENAVKFLETGDRIEISSVEEKDVAEITVKDNGPGIPKEIVESLFTGDYEKVITAVKEESGGGLGLSIVERLVREQGGQIKVNCDENGTEFKIILPYSLIEPAMDEEEIIEHSIIEEVQIEKSELVTAVAETENNTQLVQKPGIKGLLKAPKKRIEGKAKILIIDDDKDLITYIANSFSKSKFDVVKVNDGAKGIHYANEIKPDLIVLDVLMIGINGFEVLSYLKGNPETEKIPVIMLSNVRGESKALKLGAAAYLQKPVTHEAIQTLVKRLLGT